MEARRRRNTVNNPVEEYYGNSGNTQLVQTAILYATFVGMLCTGAKAFFFSGSDYGEVKQQIATIKTQLERGENEWARKSEVDIKLAAMDKHLENEDLTLKELSIKSETQNHILDQIEVNMEMDQLTHPPRRPSGN